MITILKAPSMHLVPAKKNARRTHGLIPWAGLLVMLALPLLAATPNASPQTRYKNDGPTLVTGDDSLSHQEVEREEGTARALTPPSVDLGMRLFRRTLNFNQDVLGNVPSYELPTAFSITTGFAWFPLSDMTDKFGGRIGIAGDFHYAPGISSTMGNMEEIGTDAWGMQAGIRFDFVSGENSIALGMGFGRDDFAVQDGSLDAVPGVSYEFFALDLQGRLHLANPVSMIADVGYQHLFSLGEIGSHRYFPQATGRGMYASLGFSFELLRSLEVSATFDYQRYFLAMNPEVGDRYIAGGALDERMGGNVSLSYHFHAE